MEGFKELGGVASAIIGMMATAIMGLSTANVVQWKQAAKVYGFRLAERDTLRDALNASTNALQAATKAAEERNRVIADLADAVRDMAATFEKLHERLGYQHEHMREQQRDHARSMDDAATAIGALSNSLQVNTGVVTDIRNKLMRDGVI